MQKVKVKKLVSQRFFMKDYHHTTFHQLHTSKWPKILILIWPWPWPRRSSSKKLVSCNCFYNWLPPYHVSSRNSEKKILDIRNFVILGGGLITTPQKLQWTSTCHLVKMCFGSWSSAVENLVTLSLPVPEKNVIL